jgi:hypothetical protein
VYIRDNCDVEFNTGMNDFRCDVKDRFAESSCLTGITLQLYDSAPNAQKPQTSIVKAASGRIPEAS